jgi:ubiquinone/menaquinone biosynthesis C-methylase UbiE
MQTVKKAKQTADFYNRQSHKYDRLYSSYLVHTHQKLLDRLEIQPGESVLDCSAGTGLLAEQLLKKFDIGRLVLNDPATDMLNVAKKKMKEERRDVAYTTYFAEDLHNVLPDQFDHLICLNSFHYYVDQSTVVSSFQKILNPGGCLWLLDWNRTGFFVINSKLIHWFSPMNINTRSLPEMDSQLISSGFSVDEKAEWRFRFWNFFYLKATLN